MDLLLDGSITIDELIDYLVAEAEELKLDTLKVRPKALTIIPGAGSSKYLAASFIVILISAQSFGFLSQVRRKRGIENG